MGTRINGIHAIFPILRPLKTRVRELSNRHKVDSVGVIGRLLFSVEAARVTYLFTRSVQYQRRSVTFRLSAEGAINKI